MGILDKIMFWKKKDDITDLGIDNDPLKNTFGNDNLGMGTNNMGNDMGMGTPGMPQSSFSQGNSYQQQNPFQTQQTTQQEYSSDPMRPRFQPSYAGSQQELENKNMEIISSKLDALRASIDSLNQRMANVERTVGAGEERKGRYY